FFFRAAVHPNRPANANTAPSKRRSPGPQSGACAHANDPTQLVGAADRVVALLTRHFAAAVRDRIRIGAVAGTVALRRVHKWTTRLLSEGRRRQQRDAEGGQNQLGVERCHVAVSVAPSPLHSTYAGFGAAQGRYAQLVVTKTLWNTA